MFWIHSTTRYTFSVAGNFGNNLLDRGFKIVMRVPYKFCRGPQGWGGRGMWDMVQGALRLLDLLQAASSPFTCLTYWGFHRGVH